MYEIPSDCFYRLHHIRPRFKNNVEDVLLFMATQIASLTPKERTLFKEDLNKAIRLYPGNISKTAKTIDNWRTEISALFGLIEYNNNLLRPGTMAELLAEQQDLISFFRYFLFYFQYPGGHLNDDSYFTPYETLYNKKNIDRDDVKNTQESWFHYVNSELSDEIFQADTLSIIEEYGESSNTNENITKLVMEVITKIREDKEKGKVLSTKEIGDTGEALVIQHEKNRLHKNGRDDLVHLVVKIPENLAAGYDIRSYELTDEQLRYIEVKTTTSIGKLATKSFCMSTNEWRTAKSAREKYYIYRLMISKKDISLFIIQDPVGKEREDLLNMIPRQGADITYEESAGYWEELLA